MLFTTQLNAKWFNGYFINLNQDTITCAIDIPVKNISNQLGIASLQKKVKINLNGVEKFIYPSDTKEFHINAYDGKKFKSIKVDDKKTIFVEVITEGKINLYKYDQVNEFKTVSGGGVGVSGISDAVPYIVQIGNKNYFFCKSLKKFYDYIEDNYFKERYESSYGNWGLLLESFAIDYNQNL